MTRNVPATLLIFTPLLAESPPPPGLPDLDNQVAPGVGSLQAIRRLGVADHPCSQPGRRPSRAGLGMVERAGAAVAVGDDLNVDADLIHVCQPFAAQPSDGIGV